MGCQIHVANGYISAKVKNLVGAELNLKKSVTATENILMAASLADGETILNNPAPEPEVFELISFLNSMGALIKVQNSSKIVVKGVKFLKPGKVNVKPDRIEAATFLISGLATKGSISILGSDFYELDCVKKKLTLSGAKISGGNDFLKIEYCGKLIAVDIETGSYPNFPTDIQAQYMVLNAIAKGTSVMTENIFENRFLHVQELNRLGADIYTLGKKAFIKGVKNLSGANVLATDLRASACLVIAGLVADYKTKVDRVYHIDRGYENIEVKLTALGAKIFRTNA
jgi:UDP-N-acetylglucosamine 1-carboxyvinyltransferase